MNIKNEAQTKEQEERYLTLMKIRLSKAHTAFLEAHPELRNSLKDLNFDDLTLQEIEDMQKVRTLDDLIQDVVDELNQG